MSIVIYSEDDWLQRFTHHADGRPHLNPFIFEPDHYCTSAFDTWWKDYYTKEFLDVATIRLYLTDAFAFLHKKFNKGRLAQIKDMASKERLGYVDQHMIETHNPKIFMLFLF